MDKLTATILIPCYNEEKSIHQCVKSCLNQSCSADQIIVIDDGSTDRSVDILKSFGNKIRLVELEENRGNKSYVQEYGLSLINTDIFITTDADTVLDRDFVKNILESFSDSSVAAVAGKPRSLKYNWLTSCREIDYAISHDIHKYAQHKLGYIYVIPGCAGGFRTDLFKSSISFDHDTLTEDLDFTYKLHQAGCNVAFNPKAAVYTQDPPTLYSYINQLRRWYAGSWQNLLKHFSVATGSPIRAVESTLIHFESLLFSTFTYLVLIINFTAYSKFLVLLVLSSVVAGFYTSVTRKRLDTLFYSPLFTLTHYIKAAVFIEQFIKVILLKEKNLKWFHPERRALV